MKKIVRLTESDLVRIVKRVINENYDGESLMAKYTTKNNHVLSNGGKTIKVSVGDLWKQSGLGASEFDYMVHEKSGIVFSCDPYRAKEIKLDVINKYQNSDGLIQMLKPQFCKGNSFNYDKYPSNECVLGEKQGRESFVGCTNQYKK
jgi:hypothetical protein